MSKPYSRIQQQQKTKKDICKTKSNTDSKPMLSFGVE
jgi:hypothetical protein